MMFDNIDAPGMPLRQLWLMPEFDLDEPVVDEWA
jgi:hypothetical protein